MAFRRKHRKRGRKRRGTIRRRKNNYRVTRVKGKEVSDTTYVKLTKQYLGNLSLATSDTFATTAAETIGMNHFGQNNSGVYTPVNYFNYANQYAMCSIMGSKINVQFLNAPADLTGVGNSGSNMVVGVYPLNETVQDGEAADLLQDQLVQSRCKWKTIGAADGMGKAAMKNYVSTRAMAGHPIDEETDYKIAHAYSGQLFNDWSLPNNTTGWVLFAGHADGLPTTHDNRINYVATVDYYCKFEDKVDIAKSFKKA